jgi:XapX domain-containing protein
MLSSILGLGLAFLIGASCRFFDVPLPAPPKFSGALLVLTMTLGFVLSQHWLA